MEVLRVFELEARRQATPQFEWRELFNELVAAFWNEREKLNPGLARTVAKRHLIQYKLSNSSPVSVPMNSAWRIHKQGREMLAVPLDEVELGVDVDGNEEIEMVLKKLRTMLSGLERKTLEFALDHRLPELIRELEKSGVRSARKIVYRALASVREKLRRLL